MRLNSSYGNPATMRGCRLLYQGENMDVFDQATELERLDRESALLRARAQLDQGGPDWIDGVACCRECGDPIPPKRLAALPGVGLCRSCQEEREAGHH